MIRFSEYMTQWLYGEDGYYENFKTIGKEGDFYTAVSSSIFFGGSIAKRLIETIESGFLPKDTHVVEIGAHQGYLLADMIQFIHTLKPKLLKTLHFSIIEPREKLREEQKAYFQKSFGDAITLHHYESLDDVHEHSAFIVANEIFDAFPCNVFNNNKMLYIDANTQKMEFKEIPEQLQSSVKKYVLERGEMAEGYEEFATSMANAYERFEFVTFDYGDKIPRGDMSLRIYDKHEVYPFFELTEFIEKKEHTKDIANFYKSADITYDVNFIHLKDAYEQAGCRQEMYANQSSALVAFGLIELLDILEKNIDKKTYASQVEKVKVLIDPSFMGERFKMALYRKGN